MISRTPEYIRYLATPDFIGNELQCISFRHSSWGATEELDLVSPNVQDSMGEFTGTYLGVDTLYSSADFDIKRPPITTSTNQPGELHLDAIGLGLYDLMEDMSVDDQEEPIIIIHSIYIEQIPAEPAQIPQKFFLLQLKPNPTASLIEFAPASLGDLPAGERYTIDRFPSLSFTEF